jgi:hypothetical protein
MNPLRVFRFYLIILFFLSCKGNTGGVSDFLTGQTLNTSNGEIIDTSLEYRIKRYQKGGKYRDLFDYIYFQGDNICFSFKFSDRIDNKKITVNFSHPSSGLIFPAERIDIIGNRCFGFSLLGSVLEKLFENQLDINVNSEMFCCREIKFEIIVEVREENKSRRYNFPGRFSIKYY